MFGSGFGAESEARESQRHATGRRHGPREMTNDIGQPNSTTDNTLSAQRAHENRRAQQALNMQKAPSFMEQMYSGDASRGGRAQPERTTLSAPPKNGGRDHLNVFSWENTPHNEAVPQRGRIIERSEAELRSLKPMSDASNKRDGDAKKFTANQDGNFLRFSDQPKAPSRRPPPPQSKSAPYATHYPEESADSPKTQAQAGRRRPPAQPDAAGSEFMGFPGMGKGSPQKEMDHIERYGQDSNVFLPAPAGSEIPMSTSRADAELMQRLHQQRIQPEVGVPSHGVAQQRNHGPYTTSNNSYGDKRTPQSMTPQSMTPGTVTPQGFPGQMQQGYPGPQQGSPYSPSMQSMTPGTVTPQGYPGMSRPTGQGYGGYQPPALAPGAGRPAPGQTHGEDCACPQHHQNPSPPYPPLYPDSESSTPRYLRDHSEYGHEGVGDEEKELYEYEQQLRMQLLKARQANPGDIEPTYYDYAPGKGIVETPREAQGGTEGGEDRRVRFNM